MKKILIDLMGSDLGMEEPLRACKNFLKTKKDVLFYFVGDESLIRLNATKYKIPNKYYKIIGSSEVISMNEGIMEIRRKKDSSMAKALKFLKDNEADACISAGSTPAYISGAHFLIGEIKGISRPGFMVFIPTVIKYHKVIMLDVGANLENSASDLHNFAIMASIYAKNVLKNADPKVGLLNIGTESTKGKDYHKETYTLLKNDPNINFYGNLEPRDITSGLVDIVVTDGFTGNISLKSLEGLGKNLMGIIKKELTKNLWRKLKALLVLKSFRGVKETFDYKNNAAAIVIGCKQLVIKTHGSADTKSYMATLNLTYNSIENQVVKKIEQNISLEKYEKS